EAVGPTHRFVVGFAGDVNMIRGVEARSPLAGVAELLSNPDLMMVNLETVVGEAAEVGPPPIAKEFVFRSPPETVDQLVEAGVDVLGLANNHAWDHGPAGVAATVANVDRAALVGIGAGPDADAAYEPVFLEAAGRTVGIVSFSTVPCDWSNDPAAERPEVAWACDRFAASATAAVRDAVAGSDISVVLLHGSAELVDCPLASTREVVSAWVDLGIDIVAVSHPHVLGGVERIDDGVVLWSTGNFAFVNGGGRTARSAVFEVTVGGDDALDLRVIPPVLPGGVAAPAADTEASIVRDEISTRTVGGHLDEDGLLIADDEPSICDLR
ncbi:MAG: CapA family protein, partial [Acidimicrobiales bacterium]